MVLIIGSCYLLISALPAHAALEGCEHLLNALRKDLSLLTRTEIIEELDTEFYDSLIDFSKCLNTGQSAGGGGGVAGVQGDGSAGDSAASTTDESKQVATPAANIQGTEVKSPETTDKVPATVSRIDNVKDPMTNGKIPEDIPPSPNDSLLAAQIRRAAIAETDPVKKEKLWNEYRKYQGLPLKDSPN